MHRNLYLPLPRNLLRYTHELQILHGPKVVVLYCLYTHRFSFLSLPNSGLQNSQTQETRNKQICTGLPVSCGYYIPQNTA